MASPFCVCSTHREAPLGFLESFFPFLASRKEGSQANFDKPRNCLAIFLGVPGTAEFLFWLRSWAVEPYNLLAIWGRGGTEWCPLRVWAEHPRIYEAAKDGGSGEGWTGVAREATIGGDSWRQTSRMEMNKLSEHPDPRFLS